MYKTYDKETHNHNALKIAEEDYLSSMIHLTDLYELPPQKIKQHNLQIFLPDKWTNLSDLYILKYKYHIRRQKKHSVVSKRLIF